jgi:hypothetical protein
MSAAGWHRLWFVQRPRVLAVLSTPAQLYDALATAARPSQERLHHRNLFAGGRRYYLRLIPQGFELRCDSKAFWNSRQRTARSAVVHGVVTQTGDLTTLRLEARIRVAYLLRSLFMPVWMTGLVIAAPWSPLVTGVLLVGLLGFGLAGSHFEAALQAHEMMFFVEKALEELPEGEIARLPAQTESAVITPTQREFSGEWARFYEKQRGG